MCSPLWMSIEPGAEDIRLMLAAPDTGTVLKARLRTPPAQPRSLAILLEALSAWYRLPLHAVVAADAPAVLSDRALWARLLGEAGEHDVHVQWIARPVGPPYRDRFLSDLGRCASGRRLVHLAATGLP